MEETAGFYDKLREVSLDKPGKSAKIADEKSNTLIKSGGGNGPVKPRQPAYDKVPNPTVSDR
jgi:hypothetical protein